MSVATLRPAKPVVPVFTSLADAFSPFAEPLVRVAAGLLLVPHGAQKLFRWFGGYGIDATGQFFAAKLGLPASLAVVAGIIEFFGGLLLAAGHRDPPRGRAGGRTDGSRRGPGPPPAGFFWTDGGYEYPLLWGIVALSYVIRGGGRYSVDALIGAKI